MNLEILYFAALRDLVGKDSEQLDWSEQTQFAEPPTIADLIVVLQQRHAGLSMEGVRVAVNEEFAQEGQRLEAGDTVALIPPVAGG